MKVINYFLVWISLFFVSCNPPWKDSNYKKINEVSHKFSDFDKAELYLKEKITKGETQSSLGLFTSEELLDSSHGYRHKDGHYHFGKELSYKQVRNGLNGSRVYFKWIIDPITKKSSFIEFARVRVTYPYKNSSDKNVETANLELFPEPKVRSKQFSINDRGIEIGGVSYQKSSEIKGLESYDYITSDFDAVSKQTYNMKSSIKAIEANMPTISDGFNAMNGQIARDERIKQAQDYQRSQIMAKIRANSFSNKKKSSSGSISVSKPSGPENIVPVDSQDTDAELLSESITSDKAKKKELLAKQKSDKKRRQLQAQYEAEVEKLTDEMYEKERETAAEGTGGCSVLIVSHKNAGPIINNFAAQVHISDIENSDAMNNKSRKLQKASWASRSRIETAWARRKGWCIVLSSPEIQKSSKGKEHKEKYGKTYSVQVFGVGYGDTRHEAKLKALRNANAQTLSLKFKPEQYKLEVAREYGVYSALTRLDCENKVRKKLAKKYRVVDGKVDHISLSY